MPHQIRIARPVTNLQATTRMYMDGLGLIRIGTFENHEGFDGVMLGEPESSLHFEFTYCRSHPVRPQPTPEDLVVIYLPNIEEWQKRCAKAEAAGFRMVQSFNPYWDARGKTYEDHDGYRVVLENASWTSATVAVDD